MQAFAKKQRRCTVTQILKNLLKMNLSNAKNGSWPGVNMTQPLKYRESSYSLAELEQRLTSEVNGYTKR